jgi:hypothetical protein
MAGRTYIEAPPLTDDEMRQLKVLLLRYVAHHAAGLMNVAVDALISAFKKDPKLIESIQPEPAPPEPPRVPKRKGGRTEAKTSDAAGRRTQ